MPTDTRPAVTPQLVIGVFITLTGLVMLLDRLNVLDSDQLRPFWPLVLTAIGVSMLVQRRDPSGRFWGTVWTVAGTWILFNTLGWIDVTIWQLIGPLILILIGGSVLMHAFRTQRPQPASPPQGWTLPDGGVGVARTGVPPVPGVQTAAPGMAPQTNPGGMVSLFTVMGEAKRASNDKPFRGGEMTAFMGGCVLDLRQAVVEPGEEAVINIMAVMAGHELWVPSSWAVALDVVPLLGGVDDKRLPPLEALPPNPPRLRLKGFVLMGGIVIKN